MNKKKSIAFLFSLLLVLSLLVSCAENRDDSVRGILKAEVIDGSLWITYTDDPDHPVHAGMLSEEESYLDFHPLPDGTYGVKGGKTDYLEKVEIPKTYKGKPVTKVLSSAFYMYTNLKEIIIPDSVTEIERAAFSDCRSLTSIVIPNSVRTIGPQAFYSCDSLAKTTYGNALYLGSEENPYLYLVEAETPSISTVSIHEKTRFIGDAAFQSCPFLQSVTIPNGVVSIGASAFYLCSALTSVTLSNGLTSIGNSAFVGCDSLSSVMLPDSLTSIGTSAFRDCTSLSEITIPDGITTISRSAFSGCASLASVTVGAGVTSIELYAFNGCQKLTHAIFKNPNGWGYAWGTNTEIAQTIPAEELSDPATAAKHLSVSYYGNSLWRN